MVKPRKLWKKLTELMTNIERFIEIFDRIYNEAFEVQSGQSKIKERNTNHIILPWLEDG